MKDKITGAHADLTFGPGPVDFWVSGEDVKISGKPGKGSLESCKAMFAPFPE